jgi:hypothetical protein
MGDYTLVIHGTGAHHNNKVVEGKEVRGNTDADHLLDKFVQELKDNGHVVEVATITHGGRETIHAD